MATTQAVQNADIQDTFARPVAHTHADIKIIGHSNVFYWAGNLTLTIGGASEETIQIPNVLFVNRKVKAIERLIAVKPDAVRTA
jgi:hypothetical protein